jgi:hypothetical protein
MTITLKDVIPEHEAWRELPFVRHEEGGEEGKNNWVVPRFPKSADNDDEGLRAYQWECMLGQLFAIDLLGHFTDYPDIMPTHLSDVVKDIVKGGTWGYVEIGFFAALDQFIATGKVWMGAGAWTVHPNQRLAGSAEVKG